ncbi:MAG: topoisomerase DNA-binding C4 zinc finger domain-containing protein [Paraburkholderia tropica]|nr:topoisomerase DNA-binding C4 zinc finger domain-containing protein [Paraburkholderia tropica]
MFTARGQCSSFLRELEQDGDVSIINTNGEVVQEEVCPSCKRGALVLRTSPYREFRSCSNFPACKYKPKKRGSASVPANNHGAKLAQTNPPLLRR